MIRAPSLNSALASFGMLPEKSTKMTVSVPRAAVAFAEDVHPVVRRSPCMIRARIQAVLRSGSNESTPIGVAPFVFSETSGHDSNWRNSGFLRWE